MEIEKIVDELLKNKTEITVANYTEVAAWYRNILYIFQKGVWL